MTPHTTSPSVRRLPLDESPVAVNAALALWAGLVGGLIVALGGFEDPRWTHNAWTRLLTLGVTAVALGWALQTPRVAIARRLQLGVALSLVLHTVGLVTLSQARLRLEDVATSEVVVEQSSDRLSPTDKVVVVEQNEDDPLPSLLGPVDATAPQTEAGDVRVERTLPQVAEAVDNGAEFVAPEPTPMLTQDSSPADSAAPEDLGPGARRAEMAAAIGSRAEAVAGAAFSEDTPLDLPEPAMEAVEVSDVPAVEPLAVPMQAAPEIESPSVTPLPPRRSIDAPGFAITANRARSAGPRSIGSVPLPIPSPVSPTPPIPQTPLTPQSDSTALARQAVTPGLAPEETPAPVLSASPLIRFPNPSANPGRVDTRIDSSVNTRRARPVDFPAELLAVVPAPEVAPQTDYALPPRPSPLALARSQGGFAGLADSRNAALEKLAAPEFPEVSPGAASRSMAATQALGDRPTASDRPDRPRSRVETDQAESTLPPTATNAADIAADASPGETNRTSSASTSAQNSSDAVAQQSAAVGQQQVDRGTPSIASERGDSRGDAGGQPDLSAAAGRRRGGPATPVGAPGALPLLAESSAPAGAADGGAPRSAEALNPQPVTSAPRPALAGGGPRQPRRSRGPLPQAIAAAPAPSMTAPSPLRIAMRGSEAGSSTLLPRMTDPVTLPGGSRGSPAASADMLAATSGRSLSLPDSLPDSLLPRRPSEPRRPAEAFDERGKRRERAAQGAPGEPAPRAEEAIELGLRFISQLQEDDGRWSFASVGELEVDEQEVPNVRADAAATGLSLLAMLGAGYDHYGGPYQRTVERGLNYLISTQSPSGALFPEETTAGAWQVARFYSHGIAALALCEAYGMTGDQRLRAPAQRALDFIKRTQVESLGGWRYTPGVNSDLSVTGWQVMALKSGELAGLEVDPAVYEGVASFVERCRERAGNQARFCYNPTAPASDPRTNHGLQPGTVMTSVGLLLRQHLGGEVASPRAIHGADHLLANLPTIGEGPARTSTIGNPLRDTYYWYYGTQVMYNTGGEHWTAWNDALRPVLLDGQTKSGPLAGSWHPLSPTPDKWASFGGRLYVTTMNLLSLEVHYRRLPLYAKVRTEE